MTGDEAARFYGVSRRSLYRWHDEGRLMVWEWGKRVVAKRQRGPRRDRYAVRYVTGRHSPTGRNWQKGQLARLAAGAVFVPSDRRAARCQRNGRSAANEGGKG